MKKSLAKTNMSLSWIHFSLTLTTLMKVDPTSMRLKNGLSCAMVAFQSFKKT